MLVTNETLAGGLTAQLGGTGPCGAGVKMIIADDHRGVKSALASELAVAAYFMRNLLTKGPHSAQILVTTLTLLRSISPSPIPRISIVGSWSSWRSGLIRRPSLGGREVAFLHAPTDVSGIFPYPPAAPSHRSGWWEPFWLSITTSGLSPQAGMSRPRPWNKPRLTIKN